MKFVFVGCYCEKSRKEELFNYTNGKISISATTFQEGVLKGLANNKFSPDYIVNLPAIGSFPKRCKKLYIHQSVFQCGQSKGINCGFLNLTFIKDFSARCSIYRNLRRIVKGFGNEKLVILVYSLMYPYLHPIVRVKQKHPNVKIVAIVPDMPEFISIPYYQKKIYDDVSKLDGFVLLTEQMKEKLSVGERPYEVMEGVYSTDDICCNISEERVPGSFLYTGTLDKRYGIQLLLDNFSKIDNPLIQLWICGSGTNEEIKEVKNYCDKDNRISYLGILKREEVLKLQKKAAFLINPRGNVGEFTKYSFPSKTMEYLASGTPTIMFPLLGVPAEYDAYVILLNEKDNDTIKNTLEKVLSNDYSVYEKRGREARCFIVNNKNTTSQTSKIIRVIKTV